MCNLLMQTPSTSTSGARQSAAATETQVDAASRQQLQQLADAMQQQLDLLANAVAELRQVRLPGMWYACAQELFTQRHAAGLVSGPDINIDDIMAWQTHRYVQHAVHIWGRRSAKL